MQLHKCVQDVLFQVQNVFHVTLTDFLAFHGTCFVLWPWKPDICFLPIVQSCREQGSGTLFPCIYPLSVYQEVRDQLNWVGKGNLCLAGIM